MAQPSPYEPRRVPDESTVLERLAELDRIANEGMLEPSVQTIAKILATEAPDTETIARRILAYVQSLPNVPDPSPGEYFQSVLFTVARGGDCDDKSATLVSLDRLAGLDGRVGFLPLPDEEQDHYFSESLVNGKWLWAESTTNAQLGEQPTAAAIARARKEGVSDGLA